MDDLIRQGQWWWLLLPVVTALFALFGSWLGSKLGKDSEHAQWLRNRKQELYYNFLDVENRYFSSASAPEPDPEVTFELIRAMDQLTVVAPTPLYSLANSAVRLDDLLAEAYRGKPGPEQDAVIEKAKKERPQIREKIILHMRHDIGADRVFSRRELRKITKAWYGHWSSERQRETEA